MIVELNDTVLTCKACGSIMSFPMQHATTCNPDPCEPESLEAYVARGGDVSKLEPYIHERNVIEGFRPARNPSN
jgi:hypothetical protein